MREPGPGKAAGALRTIGEVTAETGIAAHVLRYWETRFPRLRPVVRAGGRRYYRPEDVALIARIDALLRRDGYTLKGVQRLLEEEERGAGEPPASLFADVLRAIRDRLVEALQADGATPLR